MTRFSEKSVDIDRAIHIALSFLESEKFSISVDYFGERYKSVSVKIDNESGKSSIGLGKGLGRQSLASALFESIEHFYYDYEESKLELAPISHVVNLLGNMFPYLRNDLASFNNELLISCRSYESITSPGNIIFPTFLTTPDFYRSTYERDFIKSYGLNRYSTNSGTASGTTFEEAILHASLELIERDALSIFFINTVFSKSPSKPKILNISTAPKDTQIMIANLIAENNIHFTIYDITSDIGVPSYLAKLSDFRYEYNFFGSGSSISAAYAIERAVLEALQGYHAQFVQGRVIQKNNFRLEPYLSLFKRCCLEEGIFLPKREPVSINYSNLEFDGGIKKQIEFITNSLDRLNISLFWRKILDDDVKIVQVVSPDLERFYLISHGIPITPMSRGKKALMI